jgi:DNA-directed RNA polymerase subunit RPC12/RpoP
MILVGVALAIPWVAVHVHFQNFFYGFTQRPRFPAIQLRIQDFFYGLIRRPQAPWFEWVAALVLGLAFLLASLGGIYVCMSLQDLLILTSLPLPYITSPHLCVPVSFAAAIVLPIAIWKWKQRRFLRLMNKAAPRCAKCGYALRGLRVQSGGIHCPECGHREWARSVVTRFQEEKRKAKAGAFHYSYGILIAG